MKYSGLINISSNKKKQKKQEDYKSKLFLKKIQYNSFSSKKLAKFNFKK
jgi:hypothetical protein